MANIGRYSTSSSNWVDLETVIADLSLTEDTPYTLCAEGKGRICNSASEPSEKSAGFPLYNEKFGYIHKSGKLFVRAEESVGVVITIAE